MSSAVDLWIQTCDFVGVQIGQKHETVIIENHIECCIPRWIEAAQWLTLTIIDQQIIIGRREPSSITIIDHYVGTPCITRQSTCIDVQGLGPCRTIVVRRERVNIFWRPWRYIEERVADIR